MGRAVGTTAEAALAARRAADDVLGARRTLVETAGAAARGRLGVLATFAARRSGVLATRRTRIGRIVRALRAFAVTAADIVATCTERTLAIARRTLAETLFPLRRLLARHQDFRFAGAAIERRGMADLLHQFGLRVAGQCLDDLVALLAFLGDHADLHQFVTRQRLVEFDAHTIGHAFLTDHHDRIEVMREAAQEAELESVECHGHTFRKENGREGIMRGPDSSPNRPWRAASPVIAGSRNTSPTRS